MKNEFHSFTFLSLIALAVAAKEGNYVRPELTDTNELDITAGRHPLQELCVTPFVPNDGQFGGGHSMVKVITGPNASGKSVYLKQVSQIYPFNMNTVNSA